jgi:hypothetical protein
MWPPEHSDTAPGQSPQNHAKPPGTELTHVSLTLRPFLESLGKAVDEKEINRHSSPTKTTIPQTKRKVNYTAHLPTDLTRLSPFFPLNRNQSRGNDALLENQEITNSWGRIILTGPKLSIFEEDIFLASLALASGPDGFVIEEGRERPTFGYQGPMSKISDVLGYSRGGAQNRHIRRSLELLSGSSVELRPNKGECFTLGLLEKFSWNKKQQLTIVFDPFFYKKYQERRCTFIDIKKRQLLKRPTSKALHRFMLSQRSGIWRGSMNTLAKALNLNQQQKPKYMRRQLNDAIKEQVQHGLLQSKSTLDHRTDTIHLFSPKKTK